MNSKDSADMLTIIPRNCLHSLIRILNKLLKDPSVLFSMPNSVDMAYELLNILCLNPMFNQQLLFYLRNEFDFIYKHLKQIPLKLNEYELELIQQSLNYCLKQPLYSQYSWVMNYVWLRVMNSYGVMNSDVFLLLLL